MLNIDELLVPFWEGTEVFGESVMMLSENGQHPCARLFYEPEKILSVKSSDLKTEYKRGVDWEFERGRLVMPEGSRMPFMRREDCHFYDKRDEDCFKAKDGGYILYKRQGYFHKRQLSVTYTHRDRVDFGPAKTDGKTLAKTKAILARREPLTVCFYGDSITAGCDGSGMFGIAPFMPGWPELFKYKTEKTFNAEMKIINTAVGGKRSDWGLCEAEERIAAYKPDLAVIAFGMNDGTENVPPAEFGRNIAGIKEKVLAKNPAAEFIFIATTLANAESVFDGCQRLYYNELVGCAGEKDAVLNMTKVHSILLGRKNFIDMTGNNINHPNDFLIRIYAQAIVNLLC